FVGEKAKIETHAPLNGRRRFKGTLTGFDDGLLTVDCDGSEYEIHIENVLKARLNR
ncbi:MAG: ribosome maturation factor RimP, partial [bacterium]|nr:ribosome maturation factor RimP [bacterium]